MKTTSDATRVNATPFRGDRSQLRPQSKAFQCHERIVDNKDDGFVEVAFECTVAPISTEEYNTTSTDTQHQHPSTLTFHCREPSCGVLLQTESAAQKEEDGAVDCNFFDVGYTLAGKTGFQVWPGSRLLVEGLTFGAENNGDCPALQKWQHAIRNTLSPLRILELGAGVGVVGASLAAAGAQVLLTDLPTLVTESLDPNLERNATTTDYDSSSDDGPDWFHPAACHPIGQGWVAATALDWSKPILEQLNDDQCQVDVVVASDCVWLASMLDGLLNTVDSIFQQSRRPNTSLLMSFQRRDASQGDDSEMFTTVDRVLAALYVRQWNVDCLAWHPVVYKRENGVLDDSKEVFLFDIQHSRQR